MSVLVVGVPLRCLHLPFVIRRDGAGSTEHCDDCAISFYVVSHLRKISFCRWRRV